MARNRKQARRTGPTMAETADRHALYEQSVQNVDVEVEFLEETYFSIRGRRPVLFREDFCGTAAAACRWVTGNRRHHAIAVDIDPEVLGWGEEHNAGKLTPAQRARLELIRGDVRSVKTPRADILAAFNFSYWCFRERAELLDYFRRARSALKTDGLFFIDVFGGAEAFNECREKTKYGSFRYVWEQASYEPITGEYICHIHFRFKDGSKLKRAFTYHWRLWTLPELRDLLSEAGFSGVHVYWEGEDDEGEPSGEYSLVERGENDPAWITYVVAEP